MVCSEALAKGVRVSTAEHLPNVPTTVDRLLKANANGQPKRSFPTLRLYGSPGKSKFTEYEVNLTLSGSPDKSNFW